MVRDMALKVLVTHRTQLLALDPPSQRQLQPSRGNIFRYGDNQ